VASLIVLPDTFVRSIEKTVDFWTCNKKFVQPFYL